jgi:hypothetical protein
MRQQEEHAELGRTHETPPSFEFASLATNTSQVTEDNLDTQAAAFYSGKPDHYKQDTGCSTEGDIGDNVQELHQYVRARRAQRRAMPPKKTVCSRSGLQEGLWGSRAKRARRRRMRPSEANEKKEGLLLSWARSEMKALLLLLLFCGRSGQARGLEGARAKLA